MEQLILLFKKKTEPIVIINFNVRVHLNYKYRAVAGPEKLRGHDDFNQLVF